ICDAIPPLSDRNHPTFSNTITGTPPSSAASIDEDVAKYLVQRGLSKAARDHLLRYSTKYNSAWVQGFLLRLV
ncbi:MAG: hypothetical protein AAFU77_15655, partial [Myxococcota bacterium]